MSTIRSVALTVLSVLVVPLPLIAQVTAPDPGLAHLRAEVERISTAAEGRVGLAAVHVESNRRLVIHEGERFPMASTYKVPIATQLLTRVDRGDLSLDSIVALRPQDLHPGSGTLSRLFDDPGVQLSVRNLLELMLLISDNSATDLCLKLAGGADAVNGRMAALGVQGVRVDRPTSVLIADWIGVEGVPASGDVSPEEFSRLADEVTTDERTAAGRRFATDPKDTATPEGMASLLEALWSGRALSDSSTDLFWDIMERVETGAGRIRGMLPPDVTVAHKTGTIGQTTNDVGVVYLPGDAGHVIVVAFVKDSEVDVPERESVIAQVSRAVYDYFLFRPAGMD
jgi:beta-lactamase class A